MDESKLLGNFKLNRRYKFMRKVGGGTFGQVFTAIVDDNSSEANKFVAVKVEEIKSSDKLNNEAIIMHALSNNGKKKVGIPELYWIGSDPQMNICNFMVTEHLGPSLEDLFTLCGHRFSLKTVLMIADSCLDLLDYMHSCNFVHRDIKPGNFLMGLDANSHIIYLIDFGLSQRYRDSKTLCHIPYKESKNLVGTARYLSLNTHLGIEQRRRDDSESLGYMLIYFLKGTLPWKGIELQDKGEKYKKIGETKMKLTVESICSDLPIEISVYMNYCRTLGFEETPDYSFLRSLFEDLFNASGFVRDFAYDWTNPANVEYQFDEKKDSSMPFIYDVDQEFVPKRLKESSKVSASNVMPSKVQNDPQFDDLMLSQISGQNFEVDSQNMISHKPSIFFKNPQQNSNLLEIKNSDSFGFTKDERISLIMPEEISKPTRYLIKHETNSIRKSKETVEEPLSITNAGKLSKSVSSSSSSQNTSKSSSQLSDLIS